DSGLSGYGGASRADQARATAKSRHSYLRDVVLIVAAIVLVYGRALFNGFVWDDPVYLLGPRIYRTFDPFSLFATLANGIEYLPFRDLTVMLDFALWGEHAAGFHATNLLIHCCSALALYALVNRLQPLFGLPAAGRPSTAIPLATALLFAVHPLNGQAVNWISGRNVLLCGLFSLLAVQLYLAWLQRDGRQGGWLYAAALACFVCSLLSKANSITVPLVLCLLLAILGRSGRQRPYLSLVPFFLVSVAAYVLFMKVAAVAGIITDAQLAAPGEGLAVRVSRALQIPCFYIGKFLLPLRLAPEYDVTFSPRLLSLQTIGACAGIAGALVLAVSQRRRYPEILFSVGWFGITLLPVSNLYATNPIVADRYGYIPLVGLMVGGVVGIWRLKAWGGESLPKVVLAGCIAACGLLTFASVPAWKDERSLWTSAIENQPRVVVGYLGLGTALLAANDYPGALAQYAEAQKLNPQNHYYDTALGLYLLRQGASDRAIASFRNALQKKPDAIRPLYELAKIFEARGDLQKAREHYQGVVGSREHGNVFLKPARTALDRLAAGGSAGGTVGNAGQLAALGDKALAYYRGNDLAKALEIFLEMERLGGNQWELHYNIATIYMKRHSYAEAIAYFRKTLAAAPGNLDALNNLGICYRESRDYPLAIRAFEEAMTQNSRYAYAPYNLAITYDRMGEKGKSRALFTEISQRFPELKEQVRAYLSGAR
ncbi:MAG: tetratricopeptide repeat protein, partial [Geobacter sp.]|nr:tetratricopeptide repeat protein [Geobacter sp.]